MFIATNYSAALTFQLDNTIEDVRPAVVRPAAFGLADFIALEHYQPGRYRYTLAAFYSHYEAGDVIPIDRSFFTLIEKL
jgi:hypothetical protein